MLLGIEKEDFVIVNANKKHSFYSNGEMLLGCIHINYRNLGLLLNSSQILFWCNSIIDDKDIEEERVAEIYNYINANYSQQISLNK